MEVGDKYLSRKPPFTEAIITYVGDKVVVYTIRDLETYTVKKVFNDLYAPKPDWHEVEIHTFSYRSDGEFVSVSNTNLTSVVKNREFRLRDRLSATHVSEIHSIKTVVKPVETERVK